MCHYRTYTQAVAEMNSLAAARPALVRLWTTQQRYGLPSVGTCEGTPCMNWVLELTEQATLVDDPDRPDVLVSGALHGDERVGPTVTLELARWLLLSTSGWARRLLRTRRLLLMPLTNAIGYARRTRTEAGSDPNRDFSYQQKASACMETVAGRSVNEILRHHLVQLLLTYHGGMQAVGYVWGDFAHYGRATGNRSPDHEGLVSMAAAATLFAGTGQHGNRGRLYPHSPMSAGVYPVHGGMEDWAYAASWDAARLSGCTPSSHGGYRPERTAAYENASARAVVFLVETTDQKTPPEAALGGERCGAEALLRAGGEGDGHVPRNVRLALAAIDLARPHVEMLGSGRAAPPGDDACVPLRWRVWGAVAVDATWPVWRHENSSWRPAGERAAGHGVWGGRGGASGVSRAAAKADPTSSDDGVFEACVRLPDGTRGLVELAAVAVVDGAWARAPPPHAPVTPPLPPQSHIVNARTNPHWRHASQGRRVRGRKEWRSDEVFEVQILEGGRPHLPGRNLPRTRRRALRSSHAPRMKNLRRRLN